MIAAMEGHSEAVDLLIDKGAKVDICDKDDRSVLFHAASSNRIKVIEVKMRYFNQKFIGVVSILRLF
jgi:ankyrin repeat protein